MKPDVGATANLEVYRVRVRKWARSNLRPRERLEDKPDIKRYTPEVVAENRALQRRFFDDGFAGITWPKEYGGQGLSLVHEEIFLEETSEYESPDFGLLTDTTFNTCVPTMIEHASPDFLRRFVPKVLRGDALVCQFFSEPEAGSDLAAARTRATKDGSDWIIDGQKIWSSWAQLADWGMCLARTNWDVPKHSGLTWFAVPCDAPGLTLRPIRQISGGQDFCEEFFDGVRVPDTDRLSDIGDGWRVTQTMLVLERGAGRAKNNGPLVGPGPLPPDLVNIARRAKRLDDPLVRQRIARAHTDDFVGRALWGRIGVMSRQGQLNTGVAAYGKLFMGTYLPIRARLALEIGGEQSLVWSPSEPDGSEVSVRYLSGRTLSIAGGTNEMQRNAISERVLGMPRETNAAAKRPFNEVVQGNGQRSSQ